jgi:recombination protein RecA
MFGNPETTTGGRALKFYSSVRVDIRRIAADEGRRHGHSVSRTKVKSGQEQGGRSLSRGRVRHPLWRRHFSREGDVLDLAVTHNIVEKSGAWYSYASPSELARAAKIRASFLKENKDVMARLDTEVRKALGLIAAPAQPAAAAGPTATPTGRVTTMPSAPPEPVRAPIAAAKR